jgi:chaperone modulatory protein CbpM
MEFDPIAEGISLLEEGHTLTLADLVRISGLEDAELLELVEFGVLEMQEGEPPRFAVHSLTLARTAGRLRRDFGANPAGIALALTYLQRIEELEARLRELECQLLR